MNVYVFGNEYVAEDKRAIEVARELEHVANRVVPCEDVEHGHLLEGTQDQGGRCGRAGDP